MKTASILKFLMASVGLVTVMAPEMASAASLLPADALDGIGTDAIDTVKDLALQFIPITAGIAIGWFILGGTKKGLGKAGIK